MTASFPALEELIRKREALQARAQLRSQRIQHGPCSPQQSRDGRNFLAFASNDYLGLAAAPELVEAAREGASRWGVGAGASHLVSGHTAVHEELDQALARFVGMEAALGFSTGYLANLAVIPALVGREDEIFADRLNHASLVDAALLSRATFTRYAHADMAALRSRLETSKARRRLIVSDAVFSMDGDVAPLRELLALAEEFDAWLLIDDAHGFGVLGPQGRGSLAEAELHSARLILMGTLGKAAGVAGAFVAGAGALIEWLLQSARAYIFTTAAPPLLAAATLRALSLIEAGDARRAHLQSLIAALRTALSGREALLPSRTAIQPLILGSNETCLARSQALEHAGIHVPAIRPPTVPVGQARLRISLSAAHTHEDLARLIAALQASA